MRQSTRCAAREQYSCFVAFVRSKSFIAELRAAAGRSRGARFVAFSVFATSSIRIAVDSSGSHGSISWGNAPEEYQTAKGTDYVPRSNCTFQPHFAPAINRITKTEVSPGTISERTSFASKITRVDMGRLHGIANIEKIGT